MLATVHFASDAAQWVTLAALLGVMWRLTRGGTGSAVQELTAANKVLEKKNDELGAEVRDLRIEVATLRSRTDFSAVMDAHERNAVTRTNGILAVLDLIARRLGPEGPSAKSHDEAA